MTSPGGPSATPSLPESASGRASNGNPHKTRTGWRRVVHATGFSLHGLGAAWRHESAFRQEALMALVLLPAACWLGRSWLETALLIGSALLVLVVELLNSAIEATVDRISFDLHPLAKRAKDYGSAAVFIALLWCAGIWATTLWLRLSAG